MFSGEYLEDEGNIGHEIINLYKPDDKDEYYLYLVPYGDYSKEHADTDIQSVLLVRGHDANCLEVLAKATGIERVFDIKNIANKDAKNGWAGLKNGNSEYIQLGKNINLNKKQKEKRANMAAEHSFQKELIDREDIRYGGKKVYELFANNTSAKYPLSIFLTFKAKEIVKAREPFYLVNENFFIKNKLEKANTTKNGCYEIAGYKYYFLKRERLSGSAGSTFFNSEGIKNINQGKNESLDNFRQRENNTIQNEKYNYELLSKLIFDDESLWEENSISEYNHDIYPEQDTFSFLTITKKEYDELAFSNLFAYYFVRYKGLFKQLVKEGKSNEQPLNISINLDQPFEILREKNNIDLLIECGTHIFVIENKIKSGINGKKHDIYGNLVQDQLGKYMKEVEKEYTGNYDFHYLIFSPNYNKLDSSKFATDDVRKKYKIINYSEIYSIFSDYFQEHIEDFKKDKYFEDFLKAIKKHSNERDKDFEEIMKRKMQKLVDEAN